MFLFASNKFVLVLQGRSSVDTHKSLFVQCVSPTFTKIIEPLRCVSGEPVYDFYLDDTDAKIISPTIWGEVGKTGSLTEATRLDLPPALLTKIARVITILLPGVYVVLRQKIQRRYSLN